MTYYPSPQEIMDDARKVADRIRYSFEKQTLDKDQKKIEDQVLASIAIVYWDKGSKKYQHTISAELIQSLDAMPYMEYTQKVLDEVNESQLDGTGQVWCHDVAQWRLSWMPLDGS